MTVTSNTTTEARISCNFEMEYGDYLMIRMALMMYADQVSKRIQYWRDSEVPQFQGCIAAGVIAHDEQTLAQVQSLLDSKITLFTPDEKGA